MRLPDCKTSGVYMIVNRRTRKFYIGSAAKSIFGRVMDHACRLRLGKHPNVHLQRAWNIDGEGAFRCIVLEKCKPAKCIVNEQKWIDSLDATKKGYNFCPTAGSRLGCKFSKKTKLKMRNAKLGKKMSDECKAKMSAVRKGRKPTEEHKKAMRRNHWARDPERRAEIHARIVATRMARGYKHSEETKRKISETKLKRA